MLYLGIDNGMGGGISVINERQEIVILITMPVSKGEQSEYNLEEIKKFFLNLQSKNEQMFIVLEKFQVTPILGRKQAFISGKGYGEMKALLHCLNLSYEVVAPKTWQKEIFQGSNGDTKQAAIQFCKNKYPNITLTLTNRSTKEHTGLADSLCMAVYSYRKNR